MQFEHSAKVHRLSARLEAFMGEHIYPVEHVYATELAASAHPWRTPARMEALKEQARAAGLWNLFVPKDHGGELGNLEYAPLAEIMGRVMWAPEVFNCNAPDTGNMETLIKYANEAQKKQWLEPLLAGEIRSGFAMSEPAVASSDATNISCAIVRDGDSYVINGRKWFTTGGMRESCRILIVMGKTDPDNADRHRQQSMILVPRDTPGVRIVRSVTTLGYAELPFGEADIVFENVRVPAANILLGEGRGFEIAQGRLGPGRIHHCMRLIGCAQRALEQMCARAEERTAFGRHLSQHQSVREDIARSYCEIEQARLLTLMAADRMDRHGNKVARDLIAAIKITAPAMALGVLDRCIQIHGAAGLTGDFFMAEAYNYARQIRLADGPDQVHMMSLGRDLVRRYAAGLNSTHRALAARQRGSASINPGEHGMAQIGANGITLEYESFGSKRSPAVLLIHGLGAQLVHWPLELCHALVERGYRVIRFDNRDIGLSTRFDAAGVPNVLASFGARLLPGLLPYTLDDMANDAVGLLGALGIARAHLAGASMGGMIAQQVAADHPERTLSLTSIMSTTGRAGLPGPRPHAMAALMAPYPAADDREAMIARGLNMRRALASPAHPSSDAELRRSVAQGIDRAYNPAGVARQMAASFAAGDRRAKLARIRAPTVVLHGEDDPLLPVECGRDTAACIRGAELRLIPGMGHDFPLGLVPVMVDAICAAAARAS